MSHDIRFPGSPALDEAVQRFRDWDVSYEQFCYLLRDLQTLGEEIEATARGAAFSSPQRLLELFNDLVVNDFREYVGIDITDVDGTKAAAE